MSPKARQDGSSGCPKKVHKLTECYPALVNHAPLFDEIFHKLTECYPALVNYAPLFDEISASMLRRYDFDVETILLRFYFVTVE